MITDKWVLIRNEQMANGKSVVVLTPTSNVTADELHTELFEVLTSHDDLTKELGDLWKQREDSVSVLKDVIDICRENPLERSSSQILAHLEVWSANKGDTSALKGGGE